MARRFFVNGLIISSILMAAGAQAQTDLPFEVESITSFDEHGLSPSCQTAACW